MKKILTMAVMFFLLASSMLSHVPTGDREETRGNVGTNGKVRNGETEQEFSSRTRDDQGLLARWHFDEGLGNQIFDTSGNGNNGTLHVGSGDTVGGKWVEGVKGSAIEFDGENDYIEIGDLDSDFDFDSAFTLSVWARAESLDDFSYENSSAIIGKGRDSILGPGTEWPNWNLYAVYPWESGMWFSYAEQEGFTDSNELMNEQEWYHFTITWNGDSTALEMYINGVLEDSSDPYHAQTHDSTDPVYIGCGTYDGGIPNWHFNGTIDEVNIWNRALSPREIRAYYRSIKFIEKDEFGGSWFDDFEDGSGVEGTNNMSFENNDIKIDRDGALDNFDSGILHTGWSAIAKAHAGPSGTSLPCPEVPLQNPYIATNSMGPGFDSYAVRLHVGETTDSALTWEGNDIRVRREIEERNPIISWRSQNNDYTLGRWSAVRAGMIVEIDGINATSVPQNGYRIFYETFFKWTTNTDRDASVPDRWDLRKTLPYTGTEWKKYEINLLEDTDWKEITIKAVEMYARGGSAVGGSTSIWDLKYDFDNIKISRGYFSSGWITSPEIPLTNDMRWSTLSLSKTEPANTSITVSFLNASTNETIPGYDNLTARNIDISNLTANSIRLKAYFSGNGSATSSLDSWGVEWTKDNAWRDSFTGCGKCAYPVGVDEHTVGYWKFEEGCGDIARDLSGNGNDGIIEGAKWVNGRIGKGLLFDGDGDYVEVPHSDCLNITGTITVEAWINLDCYTGGNWKTIVSKGDESGKRLYFQVGGENAPESYRRKIFNYPTLISNSEIPTRTWTHVVYVADGINENLYINGTLNKCESSEFINTNPQYNLIIGARKTKDGEFFQGVIDEVRISNISRTPDEINRSYQAGIAIRGGQAKLSSSQYDPGMDPSCIGYWNFDEGEGNIVKDNSGNRNDGILSNMDNSNWVEGVRGNALEFDGVYDFVSMEDSPTLDITTDLTIAMWVKLNSINPESTQIFITKRSNADQTAPFQIFIDSRSSWGYSQNDPGIIFDIGSGNGFTICQSSIIPTLYTWTHCCFVISGTDVKIYINGKLSGTPSSFNGIRQTNDVPMRIGGTYSFGSYGYMFNGQMDNIFQYNRALSPFEIVNNYNMTYSNFLNILRSAPISLPENNKWSTAHLHRYVPENTFLNISVHDSKTDKTLESNVTHNSTDENINLSGIDPIQHPSIYLQAYFQSNRTKTPILYDWAVNWTSSCRPKLLRNIDDYNITEDVFPRSIVDLSGHFGDPLPGSVQMYYTVDHNSVPGNVNLTINGSLLYVTELSENFTGTVSVRIGCVNKQGYHISSNTFSINVLNVDDAPVWTAALPQISMKEDSNITTDWRITDHVTDAEMDELEFVLSPVNSNLTSSVDVDGLLRVNAAGDYYGDTLLIAYARQSHNHTQMTGNMNVPIRVEPENDPPLAELLSPANGSIITDTTVEFRWSAFDVDDPFNELGFQLKLGTSRTPSVIESDISGNRFTVSDLEAGTTYYWQVVPGDNDSEGICLNGTWSFTINENITIPTAVLNSPLNNSIENSTEVNLTWAITGPVEGEPIYHIYMGTDRDNLSEIARSLENWYRPSGIEDNTTYYWKVVPVVGALVGRCSHDYWSFTVNTTFEIVRNITVDIDVRQLEIAHGKGAMFNITLTNHGNVPTMVEMDFSGILAGLVNATKRIVLPVNESMKIPVSVVDTSSILPDDYVLAIEIIYLGGSETFSIPVKITSLDGYIGSTVEKDPGSIWPYIIIGIAVLVIILGIGVYFLIIKKRKEDASEDEISEDTIEADIVKPGESPFVRPAPPPVPAPPVQPAPQFAPGVKHDYSLKTGRAVPATFTAPPQVPKEEVRTIESILADVRPEIAPAPQPPAVPAPPPQVEQLPLRASAPGASPASPAPQPIPSGPQIVGIDTQFSISDMFLIYVDGRLVKTVSFGTKLSEGMDEDIMSGMLTAITDFIKDSFSEESGALKTLQYGKMNIYLERGVGMYLAVVFHGQALHNLREKMRWLLIRLWEKYKLKLKAWDGSMDGLDGLDIILRSLMGETEPQISEHAKVPSTPPAGSAAPLVSTATEAVMCNICMGVVKTGLQIINCGCGNKFHKSCGDRIGVCPKCNSPLIVSPPALEKVESGVQGPLTATVPEVPLPRGLMPPPPEEILKDETKMLPEYSGQRAGDTGEMKIDI